MRLRLFLVIFGLACSLFIVHGQVQHIENRRIFNDTTGWAGNADFSFSALQNRDLLVNIAARPIVQFKDSANYFLGIVDYNYTFSKDREFANSLLAHLRYNRYFRKNVRWAMWEFFTQGQFNPLLSQRVRALAGTGPRLRIFGNRDYKIYTGGSYMYEYEEIIVDSTIERNHRGSVYLSWFFDPVPGFTFGASTYVQPLLTDFRDFRVSGQYTLRFRVVKRLAFRFDAGFLYDSRPPSQVRNLIFNTSFGVTVDLNRHGLRRNSGPKKKPVKDKQVFD